MFLTFAVLLEWITEEVSDPVRGNGKWDSCSNLQGVDADHLPILKYQDRGKSKKTTHILTLLDAQEIFAMDVPSTKKTGKSRKISLPD